MRSLFLSFLIFPSLSFAQVNMESDRGGDKEGWGLKTDFGITLQSGNVETFSYKLGLRADLARGKNHLYLVLNNQYGEEGGVSFRDQGFGHIRWTHMRGPVGFETFTQVEYDDFRLLQTRQLNGLGLRVEFMEVLAVGISGMSDFESIQKRDEGQLDWRGSSYISLDEDLGESFKIHVVSYYQPLFKDFSDCRLYSIATLSASVTKTFSIKNQVSYAFDTRPPDGVEKKDLQFIVSFELKTSGE